MTQSKPKYQVTVERWWPPVETLDNGEICMTWRLELESLYRDDGGFIFPVDLNYLDVRVWLQRASEKVCLLYCQAPRKSWKNLHDAGYRGILAVNRYVGRVIKINSVHRATWWVEVFTVYSAFDGPRQYDQNELMKAASANEVERLQELLANGVDIESADMIGVTALCCAAESGCLNAFELLLAKGANARVITSGDSTLLHEAALGGNIKIISTLLNMELNINAIAQGGHTALGWAVMNRNGDAAAYLLEAGADPHAERAINLCDQARARLGTQHPVTLRLCVSGPTG
jgi:hypothetical protein